MNWPARTHARTLDRIVEAYDLKVAPLRDDGKTFGTPTWICCVQVDGELYVRPWNGANSRWYRAAMVRNAGRIMAAGETFDVEFNAANPELTGAIDDAYRAKYGWQRVSAGHGRRRSTIRWHPHPPQGPTFVVRRPSLVCRRSARLWERRAAR